MFGPYVCITSSNHTRRNGSCRYGESTKGPVLIRKGSWLGAHAVVTKGSTLGEGTVLAANSVLIGSSESGLYAGYRRKKSNDEGKVLFIEIFFLYTKGRKDQKSYLNQK